MKLTRTLGALTAAVLALSLAACGNDPTKSDSNNSAGGNAKPIIVGSAAFSESEILAEIYAGALKAKGIDASTKLDVGAREAYVGAIKDGTIDLIPDYTGNLLLYFDETATASAPGDVNAALGKALPSGLKVLTPAPGEDNDSLNVTSDFAQKNGLTSIADLTKVKGLKLAGNPEFKTRAHGLPGLEKIYGLKDVSFTAINDGGGPATLKALTSGKVDVADIFSTTPSITQNKLVTLKDPKNIFPAQNVVPLIRDDADNDKVTQTLNAVSAKLTTQELLDLNNAFAADSKPTAADVAKDWLSKNGLA